VPLETFGDIVNETLNYGFGDGPQVNRKRIETWVNNALEQVARVVEAPEYQSTQTLALTPGVFKYPLPTDFLRMQDIYYPELTWRLRPVDLQQFDRLPQAKLEGPPTMYTLYGTELWVAATPGNSDSLEVRYIKSAPVLKAEADVPLLNKAYTTMLVEYALMKAFAAEDDSEAATYHEGVFKKELADFANDVQWRVVDRPRVLDGAWGGTWR
jgi:hypothetical protein